MLIVMMSCVAVAGQAPGAEPKVKCLLEEGEALDVIDDHFTIPVISCRALVYPPHSHLPPPLPSPPSPPSPPPLRAAAQAEMDADALLAELKSSLEWSEGVMAALRHVWKEGGPKLIAMPKESLSIGQVS